MDSQIKTFRLPEDIIDTHIHLRGREESYKTTPSQILREAAQYSITVGIAMPNTRPSIDSFQTGTSYLREIDTAARTAGIIKPQRLYIGATDNNFGEVRNFLKISQAAGVKLYPNGQVTTGKLGVAKESSILRHMVNAVEAGKVFAVHCADPAIFEKKNGDTIEGEVKYLEKILGLANTLRRWLKLVICHVSCRESAELILQAQKEGYRHLYMELAPHYLWFDNTGTHWQPGLDPVFYKCYNGLRGPADREFLVSLLANENVRNILIGSDSACHTHKEKLEKGLGGIPSHQELVPLVITLAKRHRISEQRVADLICFNAAKIFSLDVSRRMVRHRVEERVDDLQYNHGTVTNPWNGSKLYFPVERLV